MALPTNQSTSDTRTIRSLLASTIENTMQSGVIQDTVFDATPLTRRLRESGQIKMVDGGERLRISLDSAKNSTAKSYTDLDPLDVTRQQTQTAAFYAWKQYSVSIVISGREIRINKGNTSKLWDLANGRMVNGVKSLIDKISTGLYTDGTGNGSLDITGLEAAIETTPGTVAYASVPVTNTTWQNKVATSVGAAAVNLVPNLRSVYNQASQGSEGFDSRPNLVMTTRSIHESYEAQVQPQVRYQPEGVSDLGRQDLTFKGVPIVWDDFCTSGTAYVLNLNHLYLFVHPDANFSETDEGMQKPVNQDGLVTQALFMGNLVVDNRRKQGKLQGIT